MTFRERYMAGETDFEEIFDLTDEWNYSDTTLTLRAYLGLTEEEEDVWISESDDALEELMEKERSRRIFFTDLDGTLLTWEKVISPVTYAALQELLKQGHSLVLSTGRPASSTGKLAEKLKLAGKGCYAICFNGGCTMDLYEDKIISSHLISPDLLTVCADAAKEFGIHVQAYSNEQVLVTEANEIIEYYCSYQPLTYRVVEQYAEALPQGSPKMLVIDLKHPERTAEFKKILQEKVGDKLDLFHSCPEMLEIVPKGVNKGTALEELCRTLGIPVQHSVSAGDNENDLPLIEAAGTGCAMANGIDSLKEKADYVTAADCNHDGIAEILNKFILHK